MAKQRTERVPELRTWVVVGCSPFPLDMLRYDSAHPAQESDSNTIRRSVAHDSDGWLEVHVRMRGEPSARWASYGWHPVGYTEYGALVRTALDPRPATEVANGL